MVVMTLTSIRKGDNWHYNSLIYSGEPHESSHAKIVYQLKIKSVNHAIPLYSVKYIHMMHTTKGVH